MSPEGDNFKVEVDDDEGVCCLDVSEAGGEGAFLILVLGSCFE